VTAPGPVERLREAILTMPCCDPIYQMGRALTPKAARLADGAGAMEAIVRATAAHFAGTDAPLGRAAILALRAAGREA
jgi:hypothetical protein